MTNSGWLPSNDQFARLRDIVVRRQVQWDISTREVHVEGDRPHTTFEVELWGTHQHPLELDPAVPCTDCKGMLFDLMAIAHWITPPECGSGNHSGAPCRTTLRFSPRKGHRHIIVAIDVNCIERAKGEVTQAEGFSRALTERLASLGAACERSSETGAGIGG